MEERKDLFFCSDPAFMMSADKIVFLADLQTVHKLKGSPQSWVCFLLFCESLCSGLLTEPKQYEKHIHQEPAHLAWLTCPAQSVHAIKLTFLRKDHQSGTNAAQNISANSSVIKTF